MVGGVSERCYHCGETIPAGLKPPAAGEFDGQVRPFCCHGCLGACTIIHDAGQGSFYISRDTDPGGQISLNPAFARVKNDFETYDLPEVRDALIVREKSGDLARVVLQISGIHCQSCVILNERLLERIAGVDQVSVQYENGRCEIRFDPDQTALSHLLAQIHSIGYRAEVIRPGKRMKMLQNEGQSLLWNIALSAFAAGNVMILSGALWSGYFDGSLTAKFRHVFEWMSFLLATPVFLYSAQTFHRGWKSFFKTWLPGMDVLISSGISAGYFYSVYAFFTDQGEVYFDSVTTIVFFLLVGRYLEWRARMKQRERMESLVKPLPESCYQVTGSMKVDSAQNLEYNEVPVSHLKQGDIVFLKSGDTLPADGVLLQVFGSQSGDSTLQCEVDEAILTGESMPVKRSPGDRMLAGSILAQGSALVRVNGNIKESGMAALSRLADGISQHGSRYETFTKAVIPWFSTVVLVIALVSSLVHFFLLGADLHEAIVVAVAVLIVSCPCALALAVPTATSAALYAGVRRGVLIRDGEVLQGLTRIQQFLFDKTGTLTCGHPSVTEQQLFAPQTEIATIINHMEQGNQHPVGIALLDHARGLYPGVALLENPESMATKSQAVVYVPGKGIEWQTAEAIYRLGSPDYCGIASSEYQAFAAAHSHATIVMLGSDNLCMALFALEDRPRAESAKTVRRLKRTGFGTTMLTGDNSGAASHVASFTGFKADEVHAGLLPDQKLAHIETLKEHSPPGSVAMVGDGYNDALALAAADVSVVLARGAPLSLDHAGVILLGNNLYDIFSVMEIAHAAIRTVRINLTISLLYNVIMITIAALGWLLPIWCALAMASSSLTVIASSAWFRIRSYQDKDKNSY
ncbi:MAG: heavy metal translocating P-type ATPase [Leptospiraceae bacterium]|nr:heavy metal translocating P-type ATPase [Leptospiraceae bacterium]